MPDNPQYGSEPAFDLSSMRVVALTGRDALAFAQAQFMNDVERLGDGDWQWSGWLDPKGRVQALFALVRRDAETAWLVTAGDADALAGGLRRFVFRSKVAITLPPVHAQGRLAAPLHAAGNRAATLEDAIELDLRGDGGARALMLAPSPTGLASEAGQSAWWRLDIAHGWPGLPGIALEAWTPQQLSLQRVDAFSVKKGCYPGQEIVARTHFLGKAKRGLVRIRGVTTGPLLDAGGREVGQVVAAVGDDALAVVPIEPADLELRSGDARVERLELMDGLRR